MQTGLGHMTGSPKFALKPAQAQQVKNINQQSVWTGCDQVCRYLAPAKASSAASSRRWKALAAAGLL